MNAKTSKSTNVVSILSFISGLLGPIFTYLIGIHDGLAISTGGYMVLLLGALALIFGVSAIVQVNRNSAQKGKGLAVVGLILGLLSIGLVIVQILVIGPYIQNNIVPQILRTPSP